MSNDLRFMRQLHLLTPSQIQELASCMTEASLSYELKGDEEWRQIFRVKTYKYKVGYAFRVYNMLSKMHSSKINDLSKAMSETMHRYCGFKKRLDCGYDTILTCDECKFHC